MYSQSCSFLPNKKQSPFNGSLPHTVKLLGNYSTTPFQKFEDSYSPTCIGLNYNFETNYKNRNPNRFQSRTRSIMDIMYNFGGSSNFRVRKTDLNCSSGNDRLRHHCKETINHCNSMPAMALAPSHLVGGFVGSKSQLGRRPRHGFGVKMWDIIREFLDLVGEPSSDMSTRERVYKHSFMEKKCASTNLLKNPEKVYSQKIFNPVADCSEDMLNKREVYHKQSYADVTKTKLPIAKELPSNNTIGDNQPNACCSEDKGSPLSVIESSTLSSENDNRNRITSECSIDSEDSFIVFEYCEGDNNSILNEDCSSSDDDSVIDFEVNISEGPTPACGNARLETCRCTGTTEHKPLQRHKKVRFAEGESLAKVHSMVAWDYAYRSARKGPWEMLARDSERFRCRIKNLEAVLSPVLDPKHRQAVFQQRFSPSAS